MNNDNAIILEMLEPGLQHYRFEALEISPDNTMYRGECVVPYKDIDIVFVRFFSHNKLNENGYGGFSFTLTMTDGSTRVVRGPWSSRAGVINFYFDMPAHEHIIECECSDSSTHITTTSARMLGYRLKPTWPFGDVEIYYEVESRLQPIAA